MTRERAKEIGSRVLEKGLGLWMAQQAIMEEWVRGPEGHKPLGKGHWLTEVFQELKVEQAKSLNI